MNKRQLMGWCACLMVLNTAAQQHNTSKTYVWPSDTLVVHKLQQWQGYKFGLLMHWGTYSQWGIVESWSICPEDEGWCARRGPASASYFGYVKAYEGLQQTFNPIQFNPEKWALAAKEAGMKYVVFTTKHHDGFCMFDTKETDYKITSPHTAFSSNPRSNIAKEVFSAFRKEGFMIGAYFSKPDWHSPYFWDPYFPPKDRNINYDPKKYPEKWEGFKRFTYNQVKELMTGYGGIDILWLDGGWVRPLSSIDPSVDWQKSIPWNQDIDMEHIITMARGYQPGLIAVDRTVGGAYENYVTPEQQIPDAPLPYPWESCITMGNSWSYVPNDHYKPTNELVHLLLKIVSRGGNLLLNIGPSPQGDFADTAYSRLKEIGAWMDVHGRAVYNTIPMAPYESGNMVYLQSADGKTKYVYVLSGKEDAGVVLPAAIPLKQLHLEKGSHIRLLDQPAARIGLTINGDDAEIRVPAKWQGSPAGKYAVVFEIRDGSTDEKSLRDGK